MNETQGGVNPSGYMGTGYGLRINRLPISTPQQPIIPVPGNTTYEGNLPPEAVIQGAPTAQAQPPFYETFGHPRFHGPTQSEPPLGVLGIRFGKTAAGWRAY